MIDQWSHVEETIQCVAGLKGKFPDVTLDVIGGSWYPDYLQGFM